MEIKWLNPDAKFDRLVLAGDIGGTNTNLGLVGYKDGKFTLILETVCPSQCIEGLDTPIRETLKAAIENRADLKPSHICISAAGPVANNKCVMTNLPWCVDGDAITNATGIPTLVINDFMAISYGIPTLDVDDPKQILKFKHTDGSEPKPQAATKAVIGPGTGMGVGFLAFDGRSTSRLAPKVVTLRLLRSTRKLRTSATTWKSASAPCRALNRSSLAWALLTSMNGGATRRAYRRTMPSRRLKKPIGTTVRSTSAAQAIPIRSLPK